eukprot:335875-Amphidinium_carterae.2
MHGLSVACEGVGPFASPVSQYIHVHGRARTWAELITRLEHIRRQVNTHVLRREHVGLVMLAHCCHGATCSVCIHVINASSDTSQYLRAARCPTLIICAVHVTGHELIVQEGCTHILRYIVLLVCMVHIAGQEPIIRQDNTRGDKLERITHVAFTHRCRLSRIGSARMGASYMASAIYHEHLLIAHNFCSREALCTRAGPFHRRCPFTMSA